MPTPDANPPATRPKTTKDAARAAFITGLRQIADFLDANPEIKSPTLGWGGGTGNNLPSLHIFLLDPDDDNREELASVARAMAANGQTVHKISGDSQYYVWREFAGIALIAQANRSEVCERVVVGTETVPVETEACPTCGATLLYTDDGSVCTVDPDHYRAPKPGKRVEQVEREIVEWRCQPLLAQGGGHQ